MAGAQSCEMHPCFNVESIDGVVHVSKVCSSGVLSKLEAVRTKSYPSQSAKSLLKNFSSIVIPFVWKRRIKRRASAQITRYSSRES